MKRVLLSLFVVFLLTSCVTKKKITSVKNYSWGNRMVTKKEHDSLLYQHTYDFILKYAKENK